MNPHGSAKDDHDKVESADSFGWIRLYLWRSSRARSIAIGLGLVPIYVSLDWLGYIYAYKGSMLTPWSPGLGVLFALIVRGGVRYGLILLIGVICAQIVVRGTEPLGIPATIAAATIIASVYTGAAALARYHFRINVELTRLRDILTLIATGTIGAVIVALLLTPLIIAIRGFDPSDFFPAFLLGLVGDIIGIAVISPLLLRLPRLRRELTVRHLRSIALETAFFGILILAALCVILETKSGHGSNFFYVLFLPIITIAIRHGFDGACIGLLATQIGLVPLLRRYGYDADAFTEFQSLMFTLTATGLIVGAIVSEREQVTLDYQQAEKRLRKKEMEAVKIGRLNLVSGMASALAHEINQPITAARAFARAVQHLLREPDPDWSRITNNLSHLITQIDVAGDIVRRIREFLQRGRPLMNRISVRDLLIDTMILIKPEATSAHIDIELVVQEDLPQIFGDRGQLEQVILNLVRNSIDAISSLMRPAGRICLSARRSERPSDLEISISDNGPGVSAEVADRIFEPLTTSKEGGLGLGLSICKLIIEAHGGRLWLEQHDLGTAEFRFSIPFDSARKS